MGNSVSSTPPPPRTVKLERNPPPPSNPNAPGASPMAVSITITENLFRSLTGESTPHQRQKQRASHSRPTPTGPTGSVNADAAQIQKLVDSAKEAGYQSGYAQAKADFGENSKKGEIERQTLELEQSQKQEEKLAATLEEYVNKTTSRFSTNLHDNSGAPCADYQKAVVNCYKSDPTRTLDCSELVKSFTDCSMQYRQKFIASLAEKSAPSQ